LYVWFDAVIGYLSASIEWARRTGEPEAWRRWWNDPEARSYYFMGKDNIVFHSQIWPAELLGYNGQGSRGGDAGEYGILNLPTEVVSSEYLTMEGDKFSTSRGVVILVGDFLERYQVDALRYFIAAAGPENQDSDFTWSEFLRRTNSELVAAWGNLVNRTAAMIAKSFGEIPAPVELEEIDQNLLAAIRGGFTTVGKHIEHHRFKAGVNELMRLVGEANAYVARTEPFKLKGEDQRERLATILHTLATAVVNLDLMFAPFLPHSSNTIDAMYGGTGEIAPMPRAERVEDLGGGPAHLVITGDYTGAPAWEPREAVLGAPIAKPTPVFTKLDESIVAEELARMGLEA
nr:class I tRNA ligase family protein [Actinomycetales bacterium]